MSKFELTETQETKLIKIGDTVSVLIAGALYGSYALVVGAMTMSIVPLI